MDEPRSVRPLAILGVAASVVLGGAILGATTNAINGAISPHYFRVIMGWHEVENIWTAAVAQGIFEGTIYGILFAAVFTLVVGVVSRAECPYAVAMRYVLWILAGIYGCWLAGGLIAMGLASLSPEFYRRTFVGVPDAFEPMLRYAWVGGSIWGAMFGGLLAASIGSTIFAVNWKRRQRTVSVG